MKLVVDLRLINSSGIGTYLKNVIPAVIDFFDQVTVLGNEQELNNFEWCNKVEIISFDCKIYSFSEQVNYSKIIPDCDLFWSPHFNAPLFSIRAKTRLVTIHDVNHLSNPSYYNILIRTFAKYLYKNAVKNSDYIATVSEFSKSEILKYFQVSDQKIEVVYCGVKQDFGTSSKEELNTIKLPDAYFLYVGNVKPHKNLIVLLKAYNQLDQSIKDVYKLVILGKKEGFITGDDTIFKFIRDNDLESYIHFTGYLKDEEVSFVYKKSKLFIFPSLYEGFGLPILEAMTCGVPVLSSNKASLPEIGGKGAIYFDPLDERKLKNHMIELLSNERLQNQLIEEGKQQTKKFRWETSINKHKEIFKKLL